MKEEKNLIICSTHVINLMIEVFIEIIDSQIINDNFIIFLNDNEIENIERITSLTNVIKRI